MLYQRLKHLALRAKTLIQPFELALFQLSILALLLFVGLPQSDNFVPPRVFLNELDDPSFAGQSVDRAGWEELSIFEIGQPQGIAWVRLENPALPSDLSRPLAVHSTGPFSAEFYWNGVLLGNKGVPGATAEAEQAGPIDTAISIPPDLINPLHNVLAVRYSSNKAGYEPSVVLHNLYVGPYISDARRSLRYYAPAILLSGALLCLAGVVGAGARVHSNRNSLWIAAAIGGLLLSMSAEVSRSLISYPYSWHQPRQMVIMAGLVIFAACILQFVLTRWPVPKILKGRLGLAVLCGSILFSLAIAFLETGYDSRSVAAISLIMLVTCIWLLWRALQGSRETIGFALGLFLFPVYAIQFSGDFLDRGIYALAVSFFGFVLARQRYLFWPPTAVPVPANILNVQTSGETKFLPFGDVLYLKAAGNYTEAHKKDGTWELDQRGLKQMLDELPGSFIRIHRSYAVNLEMVRSIKSAPGSRYTLLLDGNVELPIGRSYVAALRDRLGASK